MTSIKRMSSNPYVPLNQSSISKILLMRKQYSCMHPGKPWDERHSEGNITWRTRFGGNYSDISLACIFHTTKTSSTCTSIQASWQITTMKQTYSAYRLYDKLQPWNEHIVPTDFIAKSVLKSNISSRFSRNTKQFGMFSLTAWHGTSLFLTRRSPRPPHRFFEPCSIHDSWDHHQY